MACAPVLVESEAEPDRSELLFRDALVLSDAASAAAAGVVDATPIVADAATPTAAGVEVSFFSCRSRLTDEAFLPATALSRLSIALAAASTPVPGVAAARVASGPRLRELPACAGASGGGASGEDTTDWFGPAAPASRVEPEADPNVEVAGESGWPVA